jgi:molybdopterin converting factor small subunit
MEVQVLFFGSITDITIVNQLMVKDCLDTKMLINHLNLQYPTLADKKYFLAVNQKMIHDNTILKMGDKVALMPPFSGG